MSMEHLTSIYYGYVLDEVDIEILSDEQVETFIDDTWYIDEYFGQGFYYRGWHGEKMVLGVECYETDDVVEITPYAISNIVEKTREGLIEIYKELFPGRDVKEPSVLLIQREF